jgi:hypothetical protein
MTIGLFNDIPRGYACRFGWASRDNISYHNAFLTGIAALVLIKRLER